MQVQLLNRLTTSQSYTIEVATIMPEKDYSFKPTDSLWNFGELMHHIAYGIEWWTNNFLKETALPWNPPSAPASKKELLKELEQAYQLLKDTINDGISEQQTNGFYSTLDHITHHRGQATVFLRLKGITPPEYTY